MEKHYKDMGEMLGRYRNEMEQQLQKQQRESEDSNRMMFQGRMSEQQMRWASPAGGPEAWFQIQMVKTMCSSDWFRAQIRGLVKEAVGDSHGGGQQGAKEDGHHVP